ncbi:four helix bundle protein [Luteirhabdus pelagi]|jgi:four helix bundle protein|uniref:four helix bundle protein n=1 Tax=Luteirhabdus pelagi TaxID=2792783 RepID=UPI00193A06F2|nr:four helix bundle protein [Luteirhabdus pelagi]
MESDEFFKRKRIFDLEERTFQFALACRNCVDSLDKNTSNFEDGKQLIRASGSVGSNYIEANERVGDKDFVFRLRIARKEAKEAQFWLRLLEARNEGVKELTQLKKEAMELRKILSIIITKVT